VNNITQSPCAFAHDEMTQIRAQINLGTSFLSTYLLKIFAVFVG
jgi:hypothetical protein